MIDLVELVLGCESWQEAQDAADYLLGRQLISRAEALSARGITLLLTTTTQQVEIIEAELMEWLGLDELKLHRIPLVRFNHYTISGTELSIRHQA